MKALTIFIFILALSGCGNQDEPVSWPTLSISAPWYPQLTPIQGVTNWTTADEAIMTDSLHPLQLTRACFSPYAEISLRSSPSNIEFNFNTPPQSVSVVRWNESHIENQGSQDAAGYYETVESTVDGFTIREDGYVYIYQVHAAWEEGFSLFSFRVLPFPTAGVNS